MHLPYGTYLQDPVDVVEGVLGPQGGLEAVFDQGDVGLFLRGLDATELLSHGEKVCRHLAGVHQQYGPAVDMHINPHAERKRVLPWFIVFKKI